MRCGIAFTKIVISQLPPYFLDLDASTLPACGPPWWQWPRKNPRHRKKIRVMR